MCLNTAKTSGAGVIVPTQTKVIHPPDLWLLSNGDIDADECQILKGIVEGDGSQSAVRKSRAGWD